MCASNTKRYLKIVQRIFYNFIQKYVNIFKTIDPNTFLKVLGSETIRSEFSDLLLCTLIAGMKLAQPMELVNLSDIELYENNIQNVMAFIQTLQRCEDWERVYSSQLGMLVISMKAYQNQLSRGQAKLELWDQKLIKPVISQHEQLIITLLRNAMQCDDNNV